MTSPRTTTIWVGRRLPPCRTGRPGTQGPHPAPSTSLSPMPPFTGAGGIRSGPAGCPDRFFAFKASESTNPYRRTTLVPVQARRRGPSARPHASPPLTPPPLRLRHRDFQTRLAWTRTPQPNPVPTGETVATSAQAAWGNERGPCSLPSDCRGPCRAVEKPSALEGSLGVEHPPAAIWDSDRRSQRASQQPQLLFPSPPRSGTESGTGPDQQLLCFPGAQGGLGPRCAAPCSCQS